MFEEKGQLEAHSKDVHGRMEQHECEQCQKKFDAPSTLKRHVKMVHLGARNYLCDVCKKRFQIRSHLKEHVMVFHHKMALDVFRATPFKTTDNLLHECKDCKG